MTRTRTATKITALAVGLGLTAAALLAGCSSSQKQSVQTVKACGSYDSSPWAVAPSTGSSQNPSAWVSQVKAIGVGSERGFNQADPTGSTAVTGQFASSGILMWSPSGADQTFPVKDLAGWRAYVKKTLQQYPKVRSWEVWNEPPNFTADTRPADYAKIVRAAYETAHQVDPQVKIGIGAKSTYLRWLGEAIEKGAAGHFDYVTFHPYERAAQLAAGDDAPFAGIVSQVRAMLKAVDPDQESVPIRFTEVGLGVSAAGRQLTGTVSAATQAAGLVKVYALSLAQGIEQVAWFEPWDGDTDGTTAPAFGLIARNGQARPALTAYRSLISTLGQVPHCVGTVDHADGTTGVLFDNAGRTVFVAWAQPGTSPHLTTSADATVLDPVTGATSTSRDITLTGSPLLVTLPDGDVAQWQARATTTRKVNATASDRVRFRASDGAAGAAGSGGLSWLEAPDVTTVGGRKAISAASDPQVGLFVSPTFSAWRKTAVTVRIRAYGTGSGAGFNVKYDADRPVSKLDANGQASAGSWHSVPKGRWTTVTVKLKDASFTGMYGPTITLDSDSTAHSDYAISSITVTRD